MYLVNYIKMDYDDRTQRIWQAFFPSSACAATPERMAISLLCALINLITKQETSIKNYSASLESLNFTNNSENMYRGGYAQEFTPNYLIFKRLPEEVTLPAVCFCKKQSQDIPYLRHAATRRRAYFIYPGHIRCKAMPRLYVSGAFLYPTANR